MPSSWPLIGAARDPFLRSIPGGFLFLALFKSRAEQFGFQVPRSETAFVTVKLFYEHAPTGGMENRTWITFQSESRTLLPAPSADAGA